MRLQYKIYIQLCKGEIKNECEREPVRGGIRNGISEECCTGVNLVL